MKYVILLILSIIGIIIAYLTAIYTAPAFGSAICDIDARQLELFDCMAETIVVFPVLLIFLIITALLIAYYLTKLYEEKSSN